MPEGLGRTYDLSVGFEPVDLQAGAHAGDWVNLHNADQLEIIFFKAAGTDNDDPVVTFEQATDNASGGAKALTIDHYYKKEGTLTAVSTWTRVAVSPADDSFTLPDPAAQSQAIYVFPIRASSLDVNNNFDHVRFTVNDTGTNAQLGCALYLLGTLHSLRKPASMISPIN